MDEPIEPEPTAGLPALDGGAGLGHRFIDQADLTGLSVTGLRLRARSVFRTLFTEALLRECEFVRCDFSRSDFVGAVFEDCHFAECNFSIADLRSVAVARTQFEDCNFDSGSLRGNTFTDCTFTRCNFEHAGFEDNEMEGCTFDACSFVRASTLLSSFSRTLFRKTDLADCTALYHLFSDCRFEDCGINAESIGMTFGLTYANLTSLEIVWLGDRIAPHDDDDQRLVDHLIETYLHRGWLLPAAVTALNFGMAPALDSFEAAFRALSSSRTAAHPLKSGELDFLSRIIERLSKQRALPFLAIATGLETVGRLAEQRGLREERSLRTLYHVLKEAEQSVIQALDGIWTTLGALPPDVPVDVRFVFDTPPSHELRRWLLEVHHRRQLPDPPPRFQTAISGSYIEIFWMLPSTLGSVFVSLCMIERIVDRLVRIRARYEVLVTAKLPAVVRRRALEPLPERSQALVGELRSWVGIMSDAKGSEFVTHAGEIGQQLRGIEIDA